MHIHLLHIRKPIYSGRVIVPSVAPLTTNQLRWAVRRCRTLTYSPFDFRQLKFLTNSLHELPVHVSAVTAKPRHTSLEIQQ